MFLVYNVGFEVCAAIMLAVFTAFVRICNPLKKPQNVSYLNLSLSIIVTCVSDIIASALINAVSVGYNVLFGSVDRFFPDDCIPQCQNSNSAPKGRLRLGNLRLAYGFFAGYAAVYAVGYAA